MNLIELIITVSILGIIAIIAIPGVVGGIQRAGVATAARRVAQDVRLAQSNALTRGAQTRLIAFDQTGVVPNLPGISDATRANRYRIELRSGATASWPALTDNPATNPNVLTGWYNLADYGGVTVTAGSGLIFNSQGYLLNSAVPLSIGLQGPGGVKTVQTSVIGKVTIQ